MAEAIDLTLSSDSDSEFGGLPPPRDAPTPATASAFSSAVKSEPRGPIEGPPTPTPRLARGGPAPAPRFNNDPDAPHTTIVNGKGFWKSWTRSFRTTLLKLLDLVDNAVDAITSQDRPGFVGRVEIYPDVYEHGSAGRGGRRYASTAGLCLRNNSPDEIVPLAEALVVHNTTKAEAGEIGENGIGLKQACAASCDLSFVLVKNGSVGKNVELGVVARALQREEGPYLPAFQFSNENKGGSPSLREQMISLFSQPKHEDVARCIAKYGADVSGDEPSLADGVDGLCKHFDDMCHHFYGNDHVFEVILNKVRHGQEESLAKRASDAQQKITVNQLMRDLQREIPRMYLHVPDSFEFTVGGRRLAFRYWQERLVELSTFTVAVGSTIPWKQNFEVSDEHPDAYNLRLFIGFDRHRIADSDVDAHTGEKREGRGKTASLHIYSRHSGRLVKFEPDARHMLGLSATGSHYGQALTVVIDDIGGCLPLHPTKQDISFGLENKGAVHEENLFAWVGSVTKFYYNYHLRKYNGRKKVLSAKVSHYVDAKLPKEPKCYSESEFTTFELAFDQYRDTIRVDGKLAKETAGRDTYFRLLPEAVSDAPKAGGKKRGRGNAPKKKRGNKSDQESSPRDAEKTSGRSRSRPVSYREESDSDSAAETGDGNSRKQQAGKKSGQQPLSCEDERAPKRARSRPRFHIDDSDPDSDKATTEAGTANTKFFEGLGWDDLCEDFDGEGSHRPHLEKIRGSKESDARDALAAKTSKIKDLEHVIQQLRDESNSKIRTLENENKDLKKQLQQKENVISVLKRRLGA